MRELYQAHHLAKWLGCSYQRIHRLAERLGIVPEVHHRHGLSYRLYSPDDAKRIMVVVYQERGARELRNVKPGVSGLAGSGQ